MRFREGDVVECDCLDFGTFGTVAETSAGILRARWSNTGALVAVPADRCTILRRPLRVGDMLARIGGESPIAPFEFTVEDGLTPGFAENAIRLGYTHADGTPIGKWSDAPSSWRQCVAPAPGDTHPEANRAPARIVGHTTDRSAIILSPGSPSPTEEEKAAYWAGVDEREAAQGNERAENPMIRRPWRVDDVVSKLAKHIKVDDDTRITLEPRAPSIERIARALFETDADVTAFVDTRTETCGWDGRGSYQAFSEARAARYAATMQVAWDRGFAGESPEWKWYVRAVDRAKALHAVLGGGK